VDAQGRVAARIKGVTDAAQLRSLLDRILEAAPSLTSRRPVAHLDVPARALTR
jgi:hypothetical protein